MAKNFHFRFENAWLPEGWRRDVVIEVDGLGNIVAVTPEHAEASALPVRGAAIPGMPNIHSHAFQRAMAGLAEHRASSSDSFWTWRETMYELARHMTPETLGAVAAQLYVEMLKSGYTAVCEFHYVHHRPDGQRYAEPDIMSQALIEAAGATGIGMTLLPTLYLTSDFGAVPPTERQRQFVTPADEFLAMVDRLRAGARASRQIDVGVAFHSLRAVPPDDLRHVVAALGQRERGVIHIHVAEQEREVQASLRVLGQRPVEWLLANAPLDDRWCLVHATHVTAAEVSAMARCGVVVGLCPTTEANLGDGMFPLGDFLAAHGSVAIGSDSHISVSPREELRWAEYQARLVRRERNVYADPVSGSVGSRLWRAACDGGAKATGRKIGALVPGYRADIVVLDLESPTLVNRSATAIMDTHVFSGQPNATRDVMVGGRWVVQDGRHHAEAAIAGRFNQVMKALVLA